MKEYLSDLEHTIVERIVLNARAGSHISECLEDAMLLASRAWSVVEVIHNEKSYVVDPNEMRKAIKFPE